MIALAWSRRVELSWPSIAVRSPVETDRHIGTWEHPAPVTVEWAEPFGDQRDGRSGGATVRHWETSPRRFVNCVTASRPWLVTSAGAFVMIVRADRS